MNTKNLSQEYSTLSNKKLYKDFLLLKDNLDQFIYSKEKGLLIKVKRNGYVPRTAFFLEDVIKKELIENKKVLDMGCGETGLIAHLMFFAGASCVTGADVDKTAISHVKSCSNYASKINWVISDAFSNIKDKFDLIVSNPPQMPCPEERRLLLSDFHDSPGDSGREFIIRLLKESKNHLNPNGAIILLLFDFLGVDVQLNQFPSLKEIGKKLGYKFKILSRFNQKIRPGGQTEKNVDWIKKSYPLYNFKQSENEISYTNLVVEFLL